MAENHMMRTLVLKVGPFQMLSGAARPSIRALCMERLRSGFNAPEKKLFISNFFDKKEHLWSHSLKGMNLKVFHCFSEKTPDLPNPSDQVYNQIRDVKANES